MRELSQRILQNRLALFSGGLVFTLAMLSSVLIGTIYSDTQARELIQAMAPSTQTLCFAIITAAATIIPLMLTMLSIIHQIDRDFNMAFYMQIKGIVFICSAALIVSVLILLMLSIPLVESENLRSWFSVIYYTLILSVAVVAALIVMVIVMLYKTVVRIIHILSPDAT